MASAPTPSSNSPSITHLASCPNQSPPTIFSDEPISATSGSIYDRALVHPDTNNWAPRIGLAYTLFPRTVVRSAYGISYLNFNRMGGENLLPYNLPFILNPQVTQVAPSVSGGQPLCT